MNGAALKAGQAVKVPLGPNASYKLPALVAAQQDLAAREKAGEKLPAMDGPGPTPAGGMPSRWR